ncbi:outer membrane protein assembly factor BamC [Methylobacter sp.]|uniref:outer membrane protein assembly factor BamC n=1 Tax=Methylobacter sp. TaxID=2051955 RepID=UPI0011FBD336|nr:outer membrane protein assembly factor BamC [Methylobacter sp.]TAK63596.1 MAG: outer membrane protein assembly factor BamC [Methylobacter sp.]
MSVIVKSLLLIGFLVSCGTTEESRYRDTEALERPPTVISSTAKEQRTVDDSSIPKKKDITGLGSDVYQNTPTQLTIKQPFGEAWNTLGRALKQSGIKITDHERDKGQYYVTQDTADRTSFFAKATAFLSDDPTIYLLTVKDDGEETTVTATMANATEQSSAAKDDMPQPSAEGAEDLLQVLFKTLRDKLEEE